MLMCFYTSISQVLGFLIIKFCLTCWIRKAHGITKTAMLHALFFKELVVGVILIVVFWGFQRRASCRFRETKKKNLSRAEWIRIERVIDCSSLSNTIPQTSTCGYWDWEVWMVRKEMCCECKIHIRLQRPTRRRSLRRPTIYLLLWEDLLSHSNLSH